MTVLYFANKDKKWGKSRKQEKPNRGNNPTVLHLKVKKKMAVRL